VWDRRTAEFGLSVWEQERREKFGRCQILSDPVDRKEISKISVNFGR